MRTVRARYGVWAAALVLLPACGGGGDETPAPSPAATSTSVAPRTTAASSALPTPTSSSKTSTTTAPASATSPSATPSPTPSTTVATSASPTPPPVPGKDMKAADAYLEPDAEENLIKPDKANGCAAHDPDLNDVRCAVITMPGGTVTWVGGTKAETLPKGIEPTYVARVYERIDIGSDALAFSAEAPGGDWVGSDAKGLSMAGAPNDTLLFAVTLQGSGVYSGYDLLRWPAGGKLTLVAHHAEDSHAQREFKPGEIHTFAADYSDNAPNCCPNFFTHDVVRWDPSAEVFKMQALPKVPAAQRQKKK